MPTKQPSKKMEVKFMLSEWRKALSEANGDSGLTEEVVRVLLVSSFNNILKGRGEKVNLPKNISPQERLAFNNGMLVVSQMLESRVVDMARLLGIYVEPKINEPKDETSNKEESKK